MSQDSTTVSLYKPITETQLFTPCEENLEEEEEIEATDKKKANISATTQP